MQQLKNVHLKSILAFTNVMLPRKKNNKAIDDSPKTIASKLEVLIEKRSAAVSCNANRTKTVCRTVEHVNFFY